MTKNTDQIYLTAKIPAELAGKRLDQVLAALFPDHSRSRLQNWVKQAKVTVDGKVLRNKDKVQADAEIVIDAKLEQQGDWQSEPIELDVIHADASCIVVNKPCGLVVHPGAGNWDGTLVNALLHYDPELANLPRAGIIHRLDKETSGLLIIARTLKAHTYLVNAMQEREIHREYAAVINGSIISGGTIDKPIGRHPVQRKKMAILETGKPAITHYRLIERFAAHSFIRVILDTGRTHQIRVHMASIKHPLVGDPTYGSRLILPKNASEELISALRRFQHQALHAWKIEFLHPEDQRKISLECPLPQDLENLVTLLRENADVNK